VKIVLLSSLMLRGALVVDCCAALFALVVDLAKLARERFGNFGK
jgi:hypothetical protein